MAKNGSGHLDKLLDQGWNLLLFPEGTRTRDGGPGRVRRGAAVLAAAHNLSIVPIRVTGTRAAMPPGRLWPKRLHGKLFSRRHRINVSFGEPIRPMEDTTALIERVQTFFDNGDGASPSPYLRKKLAGTPSND
jgi:1-acyl-sn-glycerol-3-phosphate acyltransferase